MEWQQIIGFNYVAKLGSFTKAAHKTFRTQSALTQQIQSLEEELGSQLFERIGKRKLILTPAGEKFLEFSNHVLEKYDCLKEELNEIRGLQKGQLKLAAPFTTLYHLLPKTLEIYTQQFPWIELSLLDRSQRKVIELVKNGNVDFGIVLESVASENFQKIRWEKTETVLLTPIGHPLTKPKQVTLEQIAKYPLILPPKSIEYTNRIKLEGLLQKNKLEYQIIMESSNVELSSLYVEMGLGISFATVVTNLSALKQRNLEFIPLNHYFAPGYIIVLIRKDKVLPSFKSAFLNILLGR